MHDIVIRGGTIVDGTGSPSFEGHVSIEDGRIVAVGEARERGHVEIDAAGLLVTPGFVDIHSHYDGQVTWESRVLPSSYHGVTTIIGGNCGIGFAPAHSTHRHKLIELMEGVEDIPEAVLAEGLAWNWESFQSYLDVLDSRSFDIDVGVYVGHSPVRVYVMGDRAVAGQNATAADIVQMADLVTRAVEAGAIGFSTSRTINHRSSTGSSVPTLRAQRDELVGIAAAMGRTGKGVLQLVSDFDDEADEFALLRELTRVSGRPLTYSLVQFPNQPDLYRRLLDATAAARNEGLDICAQVAPRSPGLLMGLETSLGPFMGNPLFRSLAELPMRERLVRMRDPQVKREFLAADTRERDRTQAVSALVRRWDRMFLLGDPPNYEPSPDDSIAALAARTGRGPEEVAYDLMTSGDGTALLFLPIANYVGGSLDSVAEMLADPGTVIGLADGGAHVGFICDASFPTMALTHWGRDRPAGRLPVELLVHRQTQATARVIGLSDRGVLRPGLRADVNVIDFDALRLHPPVIQHDLPAGGRRFVQRADGYRHTFVAGVETYRDGEHTGALPGRLLRSAT